jgi:hypothetical protein
MPGNKFLSFLYATTQIVKMSISFIVTMYNSETQKHFVVEVSVLLGRGSASLVIGTLPDVPR